MTCPGPYPDSYFTAELSVWPATEVALLQNTVWPELHKFTSSTAATTNKPIHRSTDQPRTSPCLKHPQIKYIYI